jgi:ADP-ribose pyrophosphatase YjhB (NUDIX family)
MTDGQRTRVAAYALCRDDPGRILLCRIAPWILAGEVWTLPGGGLDYGEPPEAAVVRELAEETGYDGEIVELADVSDRLVSGPFADEPETDRLHAIRIVYRVRITGGELRDEPDGSTDTCAWFTLDEAKALHLSELARRSLALAARDGKPATDPPGDRRSPAADARGT